MSNLPLDDQVAGQPANDAGYAALMAVKPGERLRKARKERKLDVVAAAEQLNLSESVLRALEKDDYEALPSSTFIKGYIRSYARMLRLPGDELVRAFEYQTGLHSSMDEQHPVPDAPAKKATRLIPIFFAILVTAVVAGWLLTSGSEVEAPEVPATVVDEPTPETEIIIENQEDSVETEIEEGVPEPLSVVPEVITPEITVPVASSIAEPQPTEPSVNVSPDVEVQPGVESEPLVEDELAEAQEPQISESDNSQQITFQFENEASAAPVDAPLAKGELVMTFSDDCWVEIRDQNERLIHADLHRAGSRYARQYPEPFDVKLGNGNAVQVFYNGSPVVYPRSKRSNVARFTIGKNASEQ